MMQFVAGLRRSLRGSELCNSMLRLCKANYRLLAVGPQTEVVIEGFPRCANSFAVLAFLRSQSRPVHVAHHLHSTAQIFLGVRRKLPTLVLIRDPRDAALSLTIRMEAASVVPALDEYVWFYSGVAKVRDQVVVADFGEVTADFGQVVRRLNQRFHTTFQLFDHTQENVDAVYRELDAIDKDRAPTGEVRETHVARPSHDRRQIKQNLVAQLEQPQAAKLLQRASELYQALAPVAQAPTDSATQAKR